MTKEDGKDFNEKMKNSKDMPKIVKLETKEAQRWGGETMVIAPPIDYDKLMKRVPKGKVITTNSLREALAKKYKTDITCPLTAGIFTNICAWASYQREEDITPYWRTLKSDGMLNKKYPGGVEEQKKKLEEEGHKIIGKGKNSINYYVEDFESKLYKL